MAQANNFELNANSWWRGPFCLESLLPIQPPFGKLLSSRNLKSHACDWTSLLESQWFYIGRLNNFKRAVFRKVLLQNIFFCFSGIQNFFLTKLVCYSLLLSSIFFSITEISFNFLLLCLNKIYEKSIWCGKFMIKAQRKCSPSPFQIAEEKIIIIILQRTIAYKVQFQAQFRLTVSEN